ncbi:ABC transporter substrate-binding protein [Paenibacillus spongiae]|uniref:ABC transporter substrate-binding protein n=1 Tax=Paenibacillus spongiae TaxID=2909671 RepID=A0ABY5SF90_9BACL|nr:ABC transporter substrate-binding protein [Paenibacillus spongiae]UVI32596.1 ABC transporter substrate-binding protein [Paenibacillus spongiae]
MKQRQRFTWFKMGMMVLLTAMLLLTAACGSKAGETNDTAGSGNAVNTPANTNKADDPATSGNAGSSSAATVYPLTVKDATNVEITFNAAPQKVVTLVPSETEIMYAIGAGDQVVGVDDYSNYPAEAAEKTKIGGMEANIEAIVGLKPDLVLASSGMNQATIDKLRELKLNVYASDPKTYDAVIEKINQVGIIMDQKAEAEEVTKHMQDVRQQVQDTVKDAAKPNVYLEFSPGWTVGAGEFLDELIATAGGINIADQKGWYEIDPEQVIKSNPEVIIYASMPVKEGEVNPILDLIQKRPGWDSINALKNKQVHEVDSDPLVRVGPRLADGLQDVAKKIHPDLFK